MVYYCIYIYIYMCVCVSSMRVECPCEKSNVTIASIVMVGVPFWLFSDDDNRRKMLTLLPPV